MFIYTQPRMSVRLLSGRFVCVLAFRFCLERGTAEHNSDMNIRSVAEKLRVCMSMQASGEQPHVLSGVAIFVSNWPV